MEFEFDYDRIFVHFNSVTEELCGVIDKTGKIWKVHNQAKNNGDEFEISHEEWNKHGKPYGMIHCHPLKSHCQSPSPEDKRLIKESHIKIGILVAVHKNEVQIYNHRKIVKRIKIKLTSEMKKKILKLRKERVSVVKGNGNKKTS